MMVWYKWRIIILALASLLETDWKLNPHPCFSARLHGTCFCFSITEADPGSETERPAPCFPGSRTRRHLISVISHESMSQLKVGAVFHSKKHSGLNVLIQALPHWEDEFCCSEKNIGSDSFGFGIVSGVHRPLDGSDKITGTDRHNWHQKDWSQISDI